MNTLQQLRDHLANLYRADREAMNAGEWARADYIGNAIDDTRDQIKAIEREKALAVINAAAAAEDAAVFRMAERYGYAA